LGAGKSVGYLSYATGTTLSMTGNAATLVFRRGRASARTVFDNLPPLPPF
jgi:hypothetical protein